MKKKIVFMVINMNVGGTEKALLNMIAEMPKDKWDITILMLEKYGGFLNSIPNDVRVEYVDGYAKIKNAINKPPGEAALDMFKRKKFIKGFFYVWFTLFAKVTKNKTLIFKYLLKDSSQLKNEYDVAVAYAGPMDLISYFVAKKIKARKRIQWIHFDVTKVGFDLSFAKKTYREFDKVFIVSEEGKQKFNNLFPELSDKTATFHNVVSSATILEMADQDPGFEDNFNGIRILTVGRLSKEKGQDLVIPVLAKLRKNGINVKWYCIGEGPARQEYEQLIKTYKLEDDFILMGAKVNPYPYMKQCDIYVQPSRHEGYCITLSEAKLFRKPIVTTDFTGANEQIINNKNGFIVSFEEFQMVDILSKLCEDFKVKEIVTKN